MGYLVKHLSLVNGRWKYRKGIPAKLRPHIDGQITEFVRWLGKHEGASRNPPPSITSRYSEVDAECAALLAMAEKRAAGYFDDLNADAIAYVIAQARHELLEEDEEARFDPDVINHDMHWEKRQESLEIALTVWKQELARGQISKFTQDEVIDRCASLGLRVDPNSEGFRKLARAYLALLVETGEQAAKRQQGELVPTPAPPPPIAPQALHQPRTQSITGLAVDWWKEAERAGRSLSTKEAYTRAAKQLSEFLDHDDANAVTTADIIRFKDYRIAQGRSLKTLRTGDLSALRVLFDWGVAAQRIPTNPVEGVKVMTTKKTLERPKGFTDEEARALLSAAWHYQPSKRESPKLAAAKRWVPWLLAYTGARIGEIVQLRRGDVRRENELWIVRLTPTAGPMKTGEYRDVVLHQHLVELGFPAFVSAANDEYLFLTITQDGREGVLGAISTIKNDITEFVRTIITDPRVQPNHAWRHRFETTSRDLGKRQDVTNAITGHSNKDVAGHYGETGPEAQARFFSDWPRFEIED